jgi:hypothetical protein
LFLLADLFFALHYWCEQFSLLTDGGEGFTCGTSLYSLSGETFCLLR